MTEQKRKTARKRPAARLPTLPFEFWPEDLQHRFHRSAETMGWDEAYKARVRAALAKCVWITAERSLGEDMRISPPDEAAWDTFVVALESVYKPRTTLTYRELAAHGLGALFPETSMQVIIDSNRAERQRLTSRPKIKKRSQPSNKRKALSVADWPEEWQQRWQQALTPAQTSLRTLALLDETPSQGDGRCPSEWSDAYRGRIERGLGLLAGSMSAGETDIVSRSTICDFIGEVAHQAPRSVLTYLQEIHRGLQVLDLHPDKAWLADEIAWLKLRAHPRSRQEKLVPLGRLRAAALAHLSTVGTLPISRHTASRYRDALILALLTFRPDRAIDFHSLELGKHVRVGEERTQLRVRQHKTHQDKVSNWPRDLEAPLRLYLETYRPLLTWGQEERALWLSGKTGQPLSQSQLARITTRLTGALLGKWLSPHFIRNVYATSIAEEDPDHLPDVSLMLGHRDERSIADYTTLARSIGAANTLNDVLEDL